LISRAQQDELAECATFFTGFDGSQHLQVINVNYADVIAAPVGNEGALINRVYADAFWGAANSNRLDDFIASQVYYRHAVVLGVAHEKQFFIGCDGRAVGVVAHLYFLLAVSFSVN
jgi:hypothetical protein